MRVLVFDTETGGLDPNGPESLLSVGVVAGDLTTGEIFQADEWFNQLDSVADYVISPGAFKVHEITAAQAFSKGIPTEELANKFVDSYVQNQCVLLAGHNVQPYDIPWVCVKLFNGMSKSEFESTFTYRSLDSMPLMRLFAGVEGMKAGATLKQAVKALNIDISDLTGKYHGALFDSMCTFRVLRKFRQVLGDPEVIAKLVAK